MAKFIYSDSLAQFQSKFSGYTSSSDESYRSIAFCKDGYIVTHGQIFAAKNTTDTDNPYGLGVSITNGSVSVTIGGKTLSATLPVYKVGSGTYLTGSLSNGEVSFAHKKPSEVNASTTTIGDTNESNNVVVGSLTYDAYGHVTGGSKATVTVDQVKSSAAATNTKYYVLGHAAVDGTATTYANSKIYFQGNDLYINNSSITDLISASQALYFRGTVETGGTELPTSGVNVGDLYVVGSKGYTVGSEVCEAGDMIIAVTNTPTWTVIQRNLVNALTETNLGGSDSGNTRYVKKSSNGYLYVDQTDTNTWRAVSVGGTKQIASDNSAALNFLTGQTGITLTYDGGIKIVNSSPLSAATALTLKYTNGTTTGNMVVYNPKDTSAKELTLKAGSNVSLSYADNVLTINSSYTNTNTTYSLYVGGQNATANAATTSPYINLRSNGGTNNNVRLIGDGGTTIKSDASGNITIASINTWRTVSASADGTSAATSIDTNNLVFGKDFMKTDANSESTINLVWAEVASDGTITYTV